MRFHLTCGGTSCFDDTFRALELKKRRIKREILKKDKATCKAAEDTKKEALEMLATNRKKPLTAKHLRPLLLYHGVERKEIGNMKVGKMRAPFQKLKDDNTPT